MSHKCSDQISKEFKTGGVGKQGGVAFSLDSSELENWSLYVRIKGSFDKIQGSFHRIQGTFDRIQGCFY